MCQVVFFTELLGLQLLGSAEIMVKAAATLQHGTEVSGLGRELLSSEKQLMDQV